MKILIILGHPALKRRSFCEALAESYKAGATEGGHEVVLYKIADKHFELIAHEGYDEEPPIEPDIAAAQEAIRWADHIVLIYPLWQHMIPALLKAFLERMLTKGFAYDIGSRPGRQKKLLAGKTARLIQTMGMPAWFYRFRYRAHGAKALCDMLEFCGIEPVRCSYYGAITSASDRLRMQWLGKVKLLGSSGK